MEIEGHYTLQATSSEVWQCFIDWQRWSRTVFGIEQVEPDTASGSYRLTIHVRQAPLAGTYVERVTVTEQHAPYYCRIAIASNTEDTGQLDAFDGYIVFHLNQQEQLTVIAYKGYILSGITDDAGVPVAPLVIKGAVMLLLQQFFTRLSERVLEIQQTQEPSPFYHEAEIVHEQHIRIPPPMGYEAQRARERERVEQPWLHGILHRFGIGNGNMQEELRWTQRIRRFGVASVLLFLVWVGTRIPRR